MRLVTARRAGRLLPAVERGGYVYFLRDLLPDPPASLLEFIGSGPQAWAALQHALGRAQVHGTPLWSVELAAPIPRPSKNIFCVGRNYAEHARERNSPLPTVPVFFTKAPNVVIGPGDTIVHHPITQALDYEAELAVVIGSAGRNISREYALEHVFGYTIINDVTARDLQQRHQQWHKGKSLDTFCPMGPAIVTADEVENPHHLDIRLWVNGELRQAANTSQFIFDIPTLIAELSAGYTLEAGDIIATGTPSGVGAGFSPPRFLAAGDLVEVEVGTLGRLTNRVGPAPAE